MSRSSVRELLLYTEGCDLALKKEDPLVNMACLQTTQECEILQEKDAHDRSPSHTPPQSSLCNQTSNVTAVDSFPIQEECKDQQADVKESENVRKVPADTSTQQGKGKEDEREIVSQHEELPVISKEENQEVAQPQCSSLNMMDKDPQSTDSTDANIPIIVTIEETGYLPGGHTRTSNTDYVSSKSPTQEEAIACPDRDTRVENDPIKTSDHQEKEKDKGHLGKQTPHTPELGDGCLLQAPTTAHPSVTFATPLEEHFEYAVSLNTADETSESTLEFSRTDCETSMYDDDEDKFPDWKIPSSLDVAFAKRNNIGTGVTGRDLATIEECLKENDHSEEKGRANSEYSSPVHTSGTVAEEDISHQSGAHRESNVREESESERSLNDILPIVYREPSELLDANLDDGITGTAIKRCIDNGDEWTFGGTQDEPISSNMNCVYDSPEVKQVIASVVQQVMATVVPEKDMAMQKEYQQNPDPTCSPSNEGLQEKQLDALHCERSDAEEISGKIKEVSPNAINDTRTALSTSPMAHKNQVSGFAIQDIGQTDVGEVIVRSPQEHHNSSQLRNASTSLHQIHTQQSADNLEEMGDNVVEMEDIECRNEPLRSPGDVGQIKNHEAEDFMNNDKLMEQVDVLLSQEDKMKDGVEISERDIGADVVSPMKRHETESTCVPGRDIDSSQTLFDSFASQKSLQNTSQLQVTDGIVNSGRYKDIQGDSEINLDPHVEHSEDQISGLTKQQSGQTEMEMETIACESDPLTTSREPGTLNIDVPDTREETPISSTRGEEPHLDKNGDEVVQKTGTLDILLSQEDMFENGQDDNDRAPLMTDDVQKFTMKDKRENHERVLEEVGSPVRFSDLEVTPNGNIDSSQTLFNSPTDLMSPQMDSQPSVTDRNLDTGKPDTQCDRELDVKKNTQFDPISPPMVKGTEHIENTDRDSIDQICADVMENLLDQQESGACRNSAKLLVEEITPMDQANIQEMQPKSDSQVGEVKNGDILSGGSRNAKLWSASDGCKEAISQTHVPAIEDNTGSNSDASKWPEPRDQLQTHRSGDEEIEIDDIPRGNGPLKVSGEPVPVDVEVLHKIVSQEKSEEMSSASTTAHTLGEENDAVVPNTEEIDLLSQEDMFENEPLGASVAVIMKDDIQTHLPENNEEIYEGKQLSNMASIVKQMENTEAQDAVSRDKDSSQALHPLQSPHPSPPASITYRESSDNGPLLPASDTHGGSDKAEALCDSASGFKVETLDKPETPYSVTDSPYASNTGRDSTYQGMDIVRPSPQDPSQCNVFDKSVTFYMENNNILSGESDGSKLAIQPAVISQAHVPALEVDESLAPNTLECHDAIKAREIVLMTPAQSEEIGEDKTHHMESSESIQLEPTDIELLVEEISQKLDLTLEHLAPILPQQNYTVNDYSPPPPDPLQSDLVKVNVVRSQSQSSIICLQSLHDNMPDSEAEEANSRSNLSSHRLPVKRRSASQDLYDIPTKTQRSEGPGSQPPILSDHGDPTEGCRRGGKASVGLAHIQPPIGNAYDATGAVGTSCQSPAKDCSVPDYQVVGTEEHLVDGQQWREDQAVPDNMQGSTTRQGHLVEQEALSLYDDRTTDSKTEATYEFINKHDEKTAQGRDKFQQLPPDSATDSSLSTSPGDSVKGSSPLHQDHHTVPGSPKSSFRWRYAPSVDFDSVSVVHESMIDEDVSLETCRALPLPLVTCRRPLRVGLSRRHRGQPLHPNFRPPRRLHDV